MAFGDADSVATLGLAAAMWMTKEYCERSTVLNLVFLFGLLFAWNFAAQSLNAPALVWVFPSMTMALISVAGLGLTVLKRYGSSAIPFLVVSIGYVILQVPTYETLFMGRKVEIDFATWLAFAKLIYGGLFYTLVISPVKNLGPIAAPRLPWQELSGAVGPLQTAANSRLGIAVIGGLIVGVILRLVDYLPLLQRARP